MSYDGQLLVIGGGLMRTGTTSLHLALEKLLEGECYHMFKVIQHPDHVPQWIKACQVGLSDAEWRQLFKDYKAAVDFPPVAFFERLMEVYPDAKVVLTVRDPEKWYVSVNNTIYAALTKLMSFPLCLFIWFTPKRHFARMNHLLLIKCFGFDFLKNFKDKERIIAAFNDHMERVKKTVPADRLLVFQATDGWEPLCKFLGVPVPNEPYPHANTTEDFQASVNRMSGPQKLLKAGLLLGIAVGIGVFAYRKYGSS